jgi:hypothetical protein
MMDGPAWQWGCWAETQVRQHLLRQGFFVVPTHAIEDGGAPLLVGQVAAARLPDFQVAGAGTARWAEVKWKDHPALYMKARQFRHGIDLPAWNDYLMVERESGIPGMLIILQFRRGASAAPDPMLLAALFARLAQVAQVVEGAHSTFTHGGVYWPADCFERNPLPSAMATAPMTERLTQVIHPWEQPAQDGTAPQMAPHRQPTLFDGDESSAQLLRIERSQRVLRQLYPPSGHRGDGTT